MEVCRNSLNALEALLKARKYAIVGYVGIPRRAGGAVFFTANHVWLRELEKSVCVSRASRGGVFFFFFSAFLRSGCGMMAECSGALCPQPDEASL